MPMHQPPTLQIRVIGPRFLVDQLTYPASYAAKTALGPDVAYTRQTRTAQRAGHVRLYPTATRKEINPDDHQPH
jgi:hypothetical protein